ncbi:virion structural protein [Pseudomonas phage Phabio]|uniref:Virion structural protein n=1 Tax=Pseudomonas phage Phabio TaxID=2006668 RepID=A0A1Y0SYK4_9CAUD|nr:virion structural protein [Pseudomonas phage Phabio]ARV76833.1 virion structural protein [Pseudomonas phage Phabio]
MYQLVRSRYRLDRRSGRWAEADLSNALVSTLSATYGDIYLYVEYPGPGKPILKALHWVNVTNLIVGVSPVMTVQEWLTSVGNKTLPFDKELPNENVRLVKYAQAWHSGYNIRPIGRNANINSTASKFVKEDLLMTHPKFTPEFIRDHSMTTVNGYYHLTDWTDEGVRIYDGNTTVRKCNDNQIGQYSFETIGKLKYVPIKDEMISRGVDSDLWNGTYLTMPADVDLENKTVLFVSGGFLNVLSNVYVRTSDRTWRINFGNMMFLDRIISSIRDLDLSSLGLDIDPKDPTLINVAKLKSDECVRAYLKLSQTFFVVVDSASFFQYYEPVQSLKAPGRFVDITAKQMPLIGAYGRMLDYHNIREPGVHNPDIPIEQYFVYCATNNIRYNYDANKINWTDAKLVDGGRYPAHPLRHETAYYRFLGVEG